MNKIQSSTEKWIEKGSGQPNQTDAYGSSLSPTCPTKPQTHSSKPKQPQQLLNKYPSSYAHSEMNLTTIQDNTQSATKIARNSPMGQTTFRIWSISSNLMSLSFCIILKGGISTTIFSLFVVSNRLFRTYLSYY